MLCTYRRGPKHRRATAALRRAAVLAGLVVALALVLALRPAGASAANILWGAYMSGTTYGYSDAPFETRTIDAFESHAGKRVAIVHWGQPWYWASRGGYQPFQADMAERVRLRGSIPMITWTSEDLGRGGSIDQPDFRLASITGGSHDAFIRTWARAVKAWGHPLLIRFDHEMNGNWFNWGETVNGNARGQFAPMWKHVVDIFRQEGATNATWVWAPNRTWSSVPSTLAAVYPGASYVDWAGISGYNWGTNPAKPRNVWQDFGAVFKETYDGLVALAPGKPIMIAETASSEYGGSKAAWIKDVLGTQLSRYPQIKALVWFNWNVQATTGPMDWVIESSVSAQAAFAAAIASSDYASATFASLPLLSKVQPLAGNVLRNSSFETTGTSPWHAPWTVRNDLGATIARDATTASAGVASFRATVPTASAAAPWSVQARQSGVALSAGATYTIAFAAKASAARGISVSVQGTVSPWPVYARRDATLATGWARYTATFTAPVSDANAMIAVNVAQAVGTVWVDEVSISRG